MRASSSNLPLKPEDTLLIRHGRALRMVRIADIVCIEAVGNHSSVSLSTGEELLVYRTLGRWLQRLPAEVFARPDRTLVVNLGRVMAIEFVDRNTAHLFLDGKPDAVVLGRTALRRLRGMLKKG